MNPEIKERWITALRSNDYQQGKGELRSLDDKFCCLGVLYDIEMPDQWEKKRGVWYIDRGKSGYLSHNFAEKCGVSMSDMQTLSLINDTAEDGSFETIADWIEENL